MPEWRAYPSRITTEINSLPDTFIEGTESIGSTADAKAATQNSTNSMMALLKGIASGLNVPDGSGTGTINTSAKIYADPLQTLGETSDAAASDANASNSAIALMKGHPRDGGAVMAALNPKFRNWLRTLGAPEDPVATDTSSEWSAMSLLKAIYAAAANGTIGAAITGRAEGFVALCQGAVMQCANYMKLSRANKIAAAASEANAATSETNAATSASTASAMAGIAVQSLNFTTGNAMLGQRAVKASRDAEAAQAAAEAAAASVPTIEQSVLGIQVYS